MDQLCGQRSPAALNPPPKEAAVPTDPLLVYSVVVIAVVQTIGLILRLAGRP